VRPPAKITPGGAALLQSAWLRIAWAACDGRVTVGRATEALILIETIGKQHGVTFFSVSPINRESA
jgi:hypothetical protein